MCDLRLHKHPIPGMFEWHECMRQIQNTWEVYDPVLKPEYFLEKCRQMNHLLVSNRYVTNMRDETLDIWDAHMSVASHEVTDYEALLQSYRYIYIYIEREREREREMETYF